LLPELLPPILKICPNMSKPPWAPPPEALMPPKPPEPELLPAVLPEAPPEERLPEVSVLCRALISRSKV